MNATKLQAAATIIKDSAIEALAAKHGVTTMAIIAAIESGHPRVCEQFHALALAGISAAMALNESGAISLG